MGKLQGSPRKKGARGDSDTTPVEQRLGDDKPGADNRAVPRMPHERDESADATGSRLDESPVPSEKHMEDAIEDLKSGRRDTERKGIPSDVPAPENSTTAGRGRTRSGV